MAYPTSNMVFIEDNDSTTLECKTSPGKPVAIIKWYKDNRTPENNKDDVEMSSSSVQSLPDGVIKSVLNYTATRGDGDMRIYCTGNNIGQTLTSNRHAKLIIASSPDVPSSVAVTKVASTSVRVSLRYLSTGHMLQWFIIEVNKEDSEWIKQSVLAAFFNLSSSDVYFELTMLEQSTQYSIRVYAENILGQSGPSDIVSFKTLATEASDSPNTSPQSFSVGAISGGVVGGVILGFFLGILGSWIIMNRRTNSQGGNQPGPKITSDNLSGSDDAHSSRPPHPADRIQRVTYSQNSHDNEHLRRVHASTVKAYENADISEENESNFKRSDVYICHSIKTRLSINKKDHSLINQISKPCFRLVYICNTA
ncbi:hypothetical protein DPMN_128097 [Dreissena polymorpha]|uniref:Uncharacterized protein n=1 Tax=Dreissena polymorpha TaxID=45954 RepID=A0A9D4GYT9_DREPO|nr:hypothetical protein DPMN_128097 [Dreissena polymorpha]